ncbi:MAG: U32 family peptidase [Coriobacteriia bacterium]|nr:U32 family peptidase [Coriobacteriia bacterium]
MGSVLAPANGKGAVIKLVAAGARELYLGFHDDAWTQAFGPDAPLNRLSGFGQTANSLSFEELLDEIFALNQTAPALGVGPHDPISTYCVFNAARYSSDQVRYIADRHLPQLADAGLTGVILSGPELIPAAHANGLAAVASTMCAIYHEDLARLYRDCGMDRIILPRDVTLDAIEQIRAAVPELEMEVFLMRNGCIFADSHCMGLHKADQLALCRTLREAPCWDQLSDLLAPGQEGENAAQENDRLYKDRFHLNTCGLCALWRFEQLGVNAYKVVGRCDGLDDLCDDVELIARNIRIAQGCSSEQEYLERMERPEGLLELCANQGLSCYYPDVRF